MGNDIQRVYKLTAIVTAAVLFVLFWVLYLPLSAQTPSNISEPFLRDYSLLKAHYGLFGLILFLGGLLFTEYVLADLRPRDRRSVFLSIPASNLEKTAARWILTGVVFPVAVLLSYWLFVQFGGWIIERSLGWRLVDMPLVDNYFWNWVIAYIGLQPIFFLGAMSFRRFASVKTVLAGGITLIFLSACFSLGVYLLAPDAPTGINFWGWAVFDHIPAAPGAPYLNAQAPKFKLPDLLMTLSPLFLLISFYKFKEKETIR